MRRSSDVDGFRIKKFDDIHEETGETADCR